MDQNLKLNTGDYKFFGYFASILFHIILVMLCFLYLKKEEDAYLGKGIEVQLAQHEKSLPQSEDVVKTETIKHKTEKIIENNSLNAKSIQKKEELSNQDRDTLSASGYYKFTGSGNDTSGLVQVYAEKTLNVKIKYPLGWTFVDQDRSNKLDGVTFWINNGDFDPPPYIFLEVKEKYLFNPSKYKFNSKLSNSIAYYNDPEELEGQVSQVFYIRTETDEDYSLKLIIKGKDTFMAFQPIFFAMIKSFNFGKSLF
jgi:hypothetical protein